MYNLIKNKNYKLLFILAVITISTAAFTSCGEGFPPSNNVERLRVLGVKVDRPEINPLEMSDMEIFTDALNVSILAADETGIVADGKLDEPLLKKGLSLKWSLCQYSFRGGAVDDPNCTGGDGVDITEADNLSAFKLPVITLLETMMKMYDEMGVDMKEMAAEGQKPAEEENGEEEPLEIPQILAFEIASETQKEWGIKSIAISDRKKEDLNVNPVLEKIFIEDEELKNGDEPLLKVETGYAYKIGWEFDEDNWQRYTTTSVDGTMERRELYNLSFWTTAGAFSKEGVAIWLEDEEENELFWRAPLEVPEEGLEVTLIFNLMDGRGGCDWKYGKVLVVRGDGLQPR